MGSSVSRHLPSCLRPGSGGICGGAGVDNAVFEPGRLDETLGHSFCYVRSSSPAHSRSSSASSAAEIVFKAISGASVSANSSATLPIYDNSVAARGRTNAAGFQSSSSFSAIPLQLAATGSLDRGFFLSGPIERSAISGPLDASGDASVPFSGPLVKRRRRRTHSTLSGRLPKASFLRRSLSEKNRPCVVPLRGIPSWRCDPQADDVPARHKSVQWAHGKAGEDRIHVVVSEEQRWLFVGIYDGFNGPEAPEFLVDNLYRSVFNELRGLFWEEVEEFKEECCEKAATSRGPARRLWEFLAERDEDGGLEFAGSGRFAFSLSKLRSGFGSLRNGGRIWFPRWKFDSEEKAKEVFETPSRSSRRRRKAGPIADHAVVLRALSVALEATELAYLEMTDRAMDCNPELALMGSCLLVVLMREDDVYVMNLGDSRAIVAQHKPQDDHHEIEFEASNDREVVGAMELGALQLSSDHSTSIPEEVLRIKEEHPDDSQCIVNDRVKGRLKVTRAFGAGYLKQAKWNNGLLEIFRNEFIGSMPYISSAPSLCYYKLGPNDQFLVLSSDGLYQYLSNEEVVLHVESFIERFPDGDPAQSLVEELLFRAAKRAGVFFGFSSHGLETASATPISSDPWLLETAPPCHKLPPPCWKPLQEGMDFHELLDIPQGDRRKYHDDVTVMVISLEGRIWKSSGKYL